MADDSEHHEEREMGVEFGPLSDELDEHEYPTTTDELLSEYGEYELDLPGGSQRFEELLGPLGDQEFQDAEEVRQSVFNMVGTEAVGRDRYSDRGDDAIDREGGEESL